MSQLTRFTEQMQAMLPQWMRMAKDPTSVGAQFLNVFGLEFADIEGYLNSVIENQYIGTADIGQIDITYKVPLALPVVLDMELLDDVYTLKDNEQQYFKIVASLREFYANDGENKAILDREAGLVYLRADEEMMEGDKLYTPFDAVAVNGTLHYEYMLHHIWNAFDEFGLLLGVERLFAERNEAYKQRILDVFRKPGNATREGLKHALSREFNIEYEEVELNEFANKAFRGSLLNETDGSPTKKLLDYVERINKVFGFTWDNMSWGEAYWRSIEESQMGLEYLPHVWDASIAGWHATDFQSGIGDGTDLKVRAPQDEPNARDFNYYIGLRGRNSGLERIDPEIEFRYKIKAEGQVLSERHRKETYQYTVVASEIVKLHYIVRAMKDYFYTTVIDFDPGVAGYQHDEENNLEVIQGNTNLSKSNSEYSYYKILAELKSRSVSDTPRLDALTLKWRDTAGTLHNYSLDSQVDFTRNDSFVDTAMTDIFVSPAGSVELGFGEFYHMIDTAGSFREGTHGSTVEIVPTGSVRLNIPNK